MSNLDFLDPGRSSTLEMMTVLLLQKLARVLLKNRFRLAIIGPGKRIKYRPGTKKSKFDKTLIIDSQIKI